jgi:hypothetical protein
MRIAYTSAQKREAVALARVAGAEAAAEALGIDPRTVRGWLARAGDPPELEGNAAAWQRAFDLAHAKVEGFLASGKASAVQAATIMGIAQRNLASIERDGHGKANPAGEPTNVEQAVDEFEVHVAERYPGVDPSVVLQVLLGHERLAGEPMEADDEDVIGSWLDTLDELVQEHGSVEAAREWQRAEEHRRLEQQLAKNAAVRDAALAAAREARLDEETRALLAAAEAYLRESADA